MSRLSDIPVRQVHARPCAANCDALSPGGVAVLAEMERLLNDYQTFGHAGSIDLRWLPLVPGDLEKLRDILGTGEVAAIVDALGESTVKETAISCVWWITHRGGEDGLLGHWVEIAETASLLRSDRNLISFSLLALRGRAATFGGASYPFTNEPDAEGGNAS